MLKIMEKIYVIHRPFHINRQNKNKSLHRSKLSFTFPCSRKVLCLAYSQGMPIDTKRCTSLFWILITHLFKQLPLYFVSASKFCHLDNPLFRFITKKKTKLIMKLFNQHVSMQFDQITHHEWHIYFLQIYSYDILYNNTESNPQVMA